MKPRHPLDPPRTSETPDPEPSARVTPSERCYTREGSRTVAFRISLEDFAALERRGKPGDVARALVIRGLNGGPVSPPAPDPPPGWPTPEALAREVEEARRVLALPLPPGVLLERVRRVLGAR